MRHGVSQQTVHTCLPRYRDARMAGLVDRSRRPPRCARQISAEMERMVCDLRRCSPRRGPGAWSTSCAARVWRGFQDAPASIVCWTATRSSSPSPGVASGRRTVTGSGLARRAFAMLRVCRRDAEPMRARCVRPSALRWPGFGVPPDYRFSGFRELAS
jgi:leucine-zipper of insertion element IS481